MNGPAWHGSLLHWVRQALSPWQSCDPWKLMFLGSCIDMYRSFIHNVHKLETTQMYVYKWMVKHTGPYTLQCILLYSWKEGAVDTDHNLDESLKVILTEEVNPRNTNYWFYLYNIALMTKLWRNNMFRTSQWLQVLGQCVRVMDNDLTTSLQWWEILFGLHQCHLGVIVQ